MNFLLGICLVIGCAIEFVVNTFILCYRITRLLIVMPWGTKWHHANKEFNSFKNSFNRSIDED